MAKKIRILSIDGGGIKGILPGIILEYIENQLRKQEGDDRRLSDYFDLIAGTSTGGILTSIYLTPGEHSRPKYTASEAVDLYIKKGHEIFDIDFWHRIQSLGGLTEEKFPVANLEKNLKTYLGNTKLSELLKPCLITAYEITKRAAFFFNSVNGKKSDLDDFYVRDICRTTSAAPTYFETASIKSVYGAPYAMIDGGVFANNPALCAYAEARKMKFSEILNDAKKPDLPMAKDMIIVSIGTGAKGKPYLYKDARKWGAVGWLLPIIDILMSGNAETVSYQLKQIFKTLQKEEDRNDYYRLEPGIGEAKSAMDCADEYNIKKLVESGKRFVTEHEEELNGIVARLIANK
ncbi:MAG TPA: patatin-like phospholipase family protein [Bacteroidales bacterium]|nr:patatin-like phospholipase family protein [Bacteroidales bacterium]HPB25733.1 patatin-like phospholipase family protein [Bacteroidales bacterium]HPI30523.1 patatin-like phospholipase family protein [Bacteroidales bacterium]HQN15380.1 patatin-like phospholipase family protein [Bacteroidales bacterium]HQP14871.1 patatin-like phospholipase family protein [Bacteroidales bacterium]